MEGLSSLEGWALIATYFVAMMMLVENTKRRKKNFWLLTDLCRGYSQLSQWLLHGCGLRQCSLHRRKHIRRDLLACSGLLYRMY